MRNKTNLVPDKLRDDEIAIFTNTWVACPQNAIPNMFFTYYQSLNQRAISYFLSVESAKDLTIQYYAAIKAGYDCRLKVLLGCSEDYDPNEVSKNTPAFTPIIQLQILGDSTENDKNNYKCIWLPITTIPLNNQTFYNPPSQSTRAVPVKIGQLLPLEKPFAFPNPIPHPYNNPSLISPKTAHLFLEEWSLTNYEDIQSLFTGNIYGQIARVNSYVFLEDDLKKIIDTLNSPNGAYTLCVHLAVIKPSDRTPFQFHIVLETTDIPFDLDRSSGNNNSIANPKAEEDPEFDSTFYEFGYPCPPFCTG